MGGSKFLALSLLGLVTMCVPSLSRAADQPTTKPAADVQESDGKTTIRLFAPWSKLTTLSEEQKSQIHAIHMKCLAEIKALEAKQTSDIMVLLNEDQKKELRQIEDKTTADRKMKTADRKNAKDEASAGNGKDDAKKD